MTREEEKLRQFIKRIFPYYRSNVGRDGIKRIVNAISK